MDIFMNNNIVPFVDELIRQYAEKTRYGYMLHLSDLDELEKEKFTALLIMNDGVHDEDWAWVTNCNNPTRLSSLFAKFLMTSSKDDMLEFMEKMATESVNYYERRMQQLIDERIGLVESEDMSERGKEVHYDRINGERIWL